MVIELEFLCYPDRTPLSKHRLQRSQAAYALCQKRLAQRSDQDPHSLELHRTPYGQPFFQSPQPLSHSFSISHCNAFSVCAFSPFPIAVDCESVIPRPRAWALLQRLLQYYPDPAFLQELKVYWDQQSPLRQRLFFYRLWTLYECYAKYSGLGLWRYLRAQPLRSLDFHALWFDIPVTH